MEDINKKGLEDLIAAQNERIMNEADDEKRSRLIRDYNELMDRLIKIDSGEMDWDKFYKDGELREKQMNMASDDAAEERKLKQEQSQYQIGKEIILGGLAFGGVALSVAAYCKCFRQGLKFEQTGVITSTFMKSLIGKLKPGRM